MGKHRDHSNRTPKITLGKTQFSKIGLPRYDWHDIYHLTLTLSWPVFLTLISATFLGINALFALAYLVDVNGIENARPGSFGDAFFFSVETMATVGYGIMSPKSLYYSHIVSMTEIMAGMLGFAVATGLMFARFSRPRSRILFSDVAVIHPFNGVQTFMIRVAPVSFATLGLTFLKIGLVFFGGGFVLIPVLHQQLVDQLHWLTQQEFLDGVAIRNLTQGPISVLATFTGYHLLSVYGAVLATAALLSPSMIFMTAICVAYQHLKSSSQAQDFLPAVAPTVVGLVASSALLLWRSASSSWQELLLMVVALVLLVRFKWHPAFVLAGGAALAALGAIPTTVSRPTGSVQDSILTDR